MLIRFFSVFIISSILAYGEVSVEEYANMIEDINPDTRRISTLNYNGYAICYTNELTDAFLEYCRQSDGKRVLEVGCAYGIKSSQIVQTGVSLVANDLEPRHLDKMKALFAELSQNDPCFNKVEYLCGDITTLSQEELGTEKYDAILCENVFHFFSPEEVIKGLAALYRSLRSGGRIYLQMMSYYDRLRFQDRYESNKAAEMEWPGFFEAASEKIHRPLHLFDEDVLVRELKRGGFTPILCKLSKRKILAIAEK